MREVAQSLVKVSWWGELVPVLWWMKLNLSLCRAVLCLVVCLGMSVDLVWLWTTCLLMGRVVFLLGQLLGVRRLALEITGLWVGPGDSAEMEAFGRALAD